MSVIFKVFKPESLKEVDGEPYTFEAVISTEVKDRHGEVVKASGINIENYMKHPVLLSSHRYDDLRKQIGMVKELRRQGNRWVAKYQYFVGEGNEEADWAYKLAKKGIAAFSIGFIPMEDEPGDEEVRRIYTKSELIEISQVLVPANPEALQKRIEEGEGVEKELAELTIKAFGEELKGEGWSITGDGSLPLSDERGWDGARARDEIRRWASSDGSGEKEKVNFSMYAKGFVVGKRGSKNFGDYKLPFARVIGGKLTATKGGVIAAMAAVLGARGGVDIPEDVRKRAYSFLAKYYRRFEMEVPEYKEYDPVEFVLNQLPNLERRELSEILKLVLHIEAKLDSLSNTVEELATAYRSDTPHGGEPSGEGITEERLKSLLDELQSARRSIGGS